MPPQATPNPTPENIVPTEASTEPPMPENQPEVAPGPITPEAPRTETFQDQAILAQVPQAPAQSVQANDPIQPSPVIAEGEQKEVDKSGEVDGTWVDAVETVIDKDKDKPYEEEEDSEKLNVNFQQKTYGKEIAIEDQDKK